MSSWWRDGVLYQIYVRSWRDTNGDGIGDLRGVIEGLDYLEWLGVDGIWLNPITPSADEDWGYDVTDYRDVHPELGDLATLDELIRACSRRDIAVLLDLVPNHTSDRHPWFENARSSRDADQRDWYVWADPAPDGSRPNNWLSAFGGPAWSYDEATGQFYLHNFLPTQPDLNWWDERVKGAFDDILRFWFDRGVAGFRIDVAQALVKDQELRDNLPLTEDDHPRLRRLGQRQIYNMNRPEVHDTLRRWRSLADRYDPPRILVGETWVLDVEHLAAYYGSGDDELHLAFNFPFIYSPFQAAELRTTVESMLAVLPSGAWPIWFGSNHDNSRFPIRWCEGHQDRIRCALLLLLTLPGSPLLYYGDELGMHDTEVPHEELRDPVGLRFWPDNPGRDRARTPMPWNGRPGAGFSEPSVRPWLPLGDHRAVNVESQKESPASVLNLVRDLIALRRRLPDLQRGEYEVLPAPPGAWLWRRGARGLVALNLSGQTVTTDFPAGEVAIGTSRERDGQCLEGRLELGPWEGLVALTP